MSMAAAGLPALFIASLLASTLLPGGVEVPLYVMAESGAYSSGALLAVATAGNTLGGVATYAIGMLLHRAIGGAKWGRRLGKHFQLQPAALARVRKLGRGLPAVFMDAGGRRPAVPRRRLFAPSLLAKRGDDFHRKVFALPRAAVAVRLALTQNHRW